MYNTKIYEYLTFIIYSSIYVILKIVLDKYKIK